MCSNSVPVESPIHEKNNLKNIYYKFQNLLGRRSDVFNSHSSRNKVDMSSARTSSATPDETFLTPATSVGDLMDMSPNQTSEDIEHHEVTSDFLTGTDLDGICDVTIQDVPCTNNMFDPTSFDYLVKCSESSRKTRSVDRGKESLFVRFDPLFSQTITDSSPNYHEHDPGYETGSSASALETASASAGSMPSLRDKPTQMVPPTSQLRSTPVLMRSVSAILTPTQVPTEHLISISDTTSPCPNTYLNRSMSHGSHQSLRLILQKQNQELVNLIQENRELKSYINNAKHNYSEQIKILEEKVDKLSNERVNALERENKLVQQVNDKIMSNKQLSIVMEEYEKTMSSIIAEQQKQKMQSKEVQDKLMQERDEALRHLTSMEGSFTDLLMKYEKSKSIILEAKERENIYEQKLDEYQDALKKYESLYDSLKQVTSGALAKANESLESAKKNYNAEMKKLNITIKKHEIQLASLQESLAQKTRDNEELTRICDQLISQVR